MRAAFWSIVVLIGTAVLRRFLTNAPLDWRMISEALSSGAKNAIPVAIACACAGIILGVLGVTGLGIKLSNFILSLSGGSLFFGLVLSAVTSLILGIGLPATAIYIMMAVINAPALIGMGAPPLAVHLFLFYFGIISTLTPPVALTAYAAAAVAGAEPNKTGFKAFSMGILAYIIPFLFVYRPSLLMEGTIGSIVLTFLTGMIGVFFIGTAMHGHFRHIRIKWYERVVAGLGGLLLLDPHLSTDGLGGLLILVAVGWLFYRGRNLEKMRLQGAKYG
jgi:TRAP transporter 4TM/12TM fusion protein